MSFKFPYTCVSDRIVRYNGGEGGPVMLCHIFAGGCYLVRARNTQREAGKAYDWPLSGMTQTDWHVYRITSDGSLMTFYFDDREVAAAPDAQYISSLVFNSPACDGAVKIDWIKIRLLRE